MIIITIYIDLIFLENIIMNVIILYETAIILKVKAKAWRIIVSSCIGSIYAIVLYITGFSIFNSVFSKMILSLIELSEFKVIVWSLPSWFTLIVYVAFAPPNIKKMFKDTIIFYLTSFVFGGMALYLIYFIKPQEVLIKNGMFVGDYILKVFILGGMLAFIVIKISIKIIKTKINPKDMYCKIKIKLNQKSLETTAMIDTGNLVKEPITNTPVIIVESSLLYDIIPKEILNNLENILGGNLSQIPEKIQEEYISKLRCIPFASLGKQNGMLVGIKSNEVEIAKDELNEKYKNIIIGIYDKSLTKRGEYRALIGIELLPQ